MKELMRNGREAMESKGKSFIAFPSTLESSPPLNQISFNSQPWSLNRVKHIALLFLYNDLRTWKCAYKNNMCLNDWELNLSCTLSLHAK